MKTVNLKLAHNYDNPLAAAVAATVQLQQRGLTASIRDALQQKDREFIAQAWGELVEYHGTDSKEISVLRQVLNRVSKEPECGGMPLTVELHHNEFTVVKAKARSKGTSPQTLVKVSKRIGNMAKGRTDAEKLSVLKALAAEMGLNVRISQVAAKKAA